MVSARGKSEILKETLDIVLSFDLLQNIAALYGPYLKKQMGLSWKKSNEEQLTFVTCKYKCTDNVSEMLHSLGWPTLEACRKEQSFFL